MAGSSHKSFLDRILSSTGRCECCENDGNSNLQDIEMAPELHPIPVDLYEENESESSFQMELRETPVKPAVSSNSTPSTSPPCSDSSIEDMPQTQTEPSTTLPSSQKTTEAMPQAQKESGKISIPQKQHSLESRDSVVSLMSRQVSSVSQRIRHHKKTIKIAVVVCGLIFTAMIVGQIVAMKGDGGEDQGSRGNSTDVSGT